MGAGRAPAEGTAPGPIIGFVTYDAFVKLTGHSLVTGLWLVLAVSYRAAAVITAPPLYRYWSAVVAVALVALDRATRFPVGR